MRITKIFTTLALVAVWPLAAAAQDSSISTFSPYTFYGIGDITSQGTTMARSMGGAVVGFQSPVYINIVNPAANSAIYRKSFLMDFGVEGGGYYLRNDATKSSYNAFTIRDIAIQFPVYEKIGVSVSLTPYSNVGYRVQRDETDPRIRQTIGEITYKYVGEGDVSEFKIGVGAELFKNFSLGAEMKYYLGSIKRTASEKIYPYLAPTTPATTSIQSSESVSHILGGFGLQYRIIANTKRMLTLGAVYGIGGKLNSEVTRFIPSNNLLGDTVSIVTGRSDFALPTSVTAGLFYQTSKLSLGADYTFNKWSGINANDAVNNISYTDTHAVKIGGQYTPNRYDVRRLLNRWTYRAGMRYQTYYLKFDGHQIADKALSLGVGIPVNMTGMTNIDLGLEFGTRGTTKYNLIKENYVKFSIGLSLFGEDDWFKKLKFD